MQQSDTPQNIPNYLSEYNSNSPMSKTVRIADTLYEELLKLANERDVPIATVTNEIVRTGLECAQVAREDCVELLRDSLNRERQINNKLLDIIEKRLTKNDDGFHEKF